MSLIPEPWEIRPRPPGRRQTADQRRESVLAAATAAFAAKGLYGSTTEQIARAAGISQPYVFRLFGSKMNLFIAVLTRALLEADDHGGRRGYAAQRILLHALAARDEPQIRARLLAARASGRTDEPPSEQTHVDIRALVLRFAADTTGSTTAPPRSGGSAPPSFRPRKTK